MSIDFLKLFFTLYLKNLGQFFIRDYPLWNFTLVRYSDKFFEFSRFFTQFDTITFTLYHTKISTFHLLLYFLLIHYDYICLDESKMFHICFLYRFLLPVAVFILSICCSVHIAFFTACIWSFYVVVCAFMYVYLTSILKSLE